MGKQAHSILSVAARWALASVLLAGASPVLAQANLTDTSFSGPASYIPGSATSSTYTLVVNNRGDAANTPTTTTSFPSGVTVSWTCSASGTGSSCATSSGSGDLNRSTDVVGARTGGNDGELTYAITASFASSMTASPLVVAAVITPAGGSALNRSASSTRDLRSNLSVNKTVPGSSYSAPGSVTYTVVAGNAGPSDVSGATLVDTAPSGVSFGTRTCTASGGASCPAAGSGNLSLSLNIPAGGSLSFGIPATIASGTQADPLVNTASISAPSGTTDPIASNNANSANLNLIKADLAVVFVPASPTASPTATYTPGSTGNTLDIRVNNNGNFASTGSQLTVTLPPQVSAATASCVAPATCTAASGTGSLALDLGAIASGANLTVRLSLDYPSDAGAANINIVAAIDGDEPDLSTGNNSSTWRATLLRQVRIGLSKSSGATSVSPGAAITYDIVVTNLGPSDVGNVAGDTGILLSDTLSPQLGRNLASGTCSNNGQTVPCWRYCPSDNGVVGNLTTANCAVELVEGDGSFANQGFRLRAGSSSTLKVFATVGANVNGSFSNDALARVQGSLGVSDQAAGDCPLTGSNTLCRRDTIGVQASTDIEVTVTDGATSAVPGLDQAYTVVVLNNGTLTANNVNLQTALPILVSDGSAGFASGSTGWQCRAFNGACCTHNSNVCGTTGLTPRIAAASINQGVDLPPQSRVEFTFSGRLDARALGTLNVNAVATPPAGLNDGTPGNNQRSDSDTVLVPNATLSVSKVLDNIVSVATPIPPAAVGEGPPFRLSYRILVSNAGPSVARNATLSDDLQSSLLVSATGTWCIVLEAAGLTGCSPTSGTGPLSQSLRLDPGDVVRVDLSVDTTAIASGEVVNTARVTSDAGSAEATAVSGLTGSSELSITLTDGRSEAVPGTPTNYSIRVRNDGPDDAFGARVSALFPSSLESVSWSCSAITPIPGDLSFSNQGGLENQRASALLMSAGGEHAYLALPESNAIQVLARNAVPGQGFGELAILETETNGANDPGDSGSTVAGLLNPIDLALSPNGALLYVLARPLTGPGVPSLVSFSRVNNPADPAFGRLSYAGTLATGVPVQAQRVLVTTGHVYVSGSSPQEISIFRRDAASGLPIHDSVHTGSVPVGAGALALDRGRARLFVAGSGSQIVQFAINTDAASGPLGRLSVQGPAFNSTLSGIVDLSIVPANRTLYASSAGSARLNLVNYADTGLSPVASYSRTATDAPGAAADPLSGFGRLAIAPDGEHLYRVSASAGTLLGFRRDALSGTLSEGRALYAAAATPGLASANAVAVSGDGRHVLIANASGSGRPLHAYARRAPDPLFAFLEQDRNEVGPVRGLLSPADIVVSPDGRHVYSVSLQDGALSVFERFSRRGLDGATEGDHLEFRKRYVDGQDGVIGGLERASRVLISADGLSVFVTSEDRNTLTVFNRDASEVSAGFGLLSFAARFTDGVGGVDGLLGAQGMAIDPDGRHLYVAGAFEAAIAIFRRDPSTRVLSYQGQVRNGSAGISGLSGIRDLLVSRDGRQLLGVSAISNSVVVFNRDRSLALAEGGRLSFVQALNLQSGARLISLSMPQGPLPTDGEHVYVAGQNTSRLFVLRRNTDVTSPNFGRLAPAFAYSSGQPGLSAMNGPRDVQVSPDGRRVYVAAQFGSSVLVFDRDLNRSGAGYGGLSLLETRTDGLDGVDGLNDVYAVALSPDSRNVYAAGFGDRAIASFAVGSGSSCSAGGSGDIDDRVNLGVGGTLEYAVQAMIRPGAVGSLVTAAAIQAPARFIDPTTGNNLATDSTLLTPRGDLAVTKTNNRVSVVGGETVSYEVVVRNAGPSHLRHTPAEVVQINDRLSALPGFEPGSVSWTCTAAGSGALGFVDAYANDASGEPGLGGVTGLALVPDSDAAGPIPAYLAAASVLDNRLLLFRRDAVDGRLLLAASVAQGQTLGGTPISQFLGTRSVAVSADSRFLYVASRESDSLSVFELSHSGSAPSLALRQTLQGVVGLDQALHLVLSPDGGFVYVAGANDAAIAVFSRDDITGLLTFVETEQNGVNDGSDAGGVVAGLVDVEFMVLSPDGAHLYALSGASGSVALFDRDSASGRLSFRSARGAAEFGVSTDGASGAAFDPSGRHLYLAASGANSLLVLNRDIAVAGGNYGQLSFGSSLQQGVADVQGLLGARRVALSADGVHVYVTGQSGGSIAWFVRDPGNGSLRFLGLRASGSGGVAGLDGATGLVVDSVSNHVYVAGSLAPGAAGSLAGGLAVFQREADSVCPASGTGDLVDVPISVASGGNVTFTIQARVSSSVAVGSSLINRVEITAPQDTTPDNNRAEDIDVVALVADLSIRKDDGLAEFDGLAGAVSVTGDAQRLYVAGATDNAIGVFRRINDAGQPQDGELRFATVLRNGVGAVTGIGGVAGVLASPDGAHLYAVSPIENTVAVFRRLPAPAELEFVEVEQNGVFGVSGLAGASALALSADGRHLYVAGTFANAIAVFGRNADSAAADFGRLTYQGLVQNGVGGVDGLAGINALRVSPDGKHVYALGAANSTLAVFARNPNSGSAGFGQLSYLRRYVNGQDGIGGLTGMVGLAISADGARLWAAGGLTGGLVSFTRNPADGALSVAGIAREGVAGAQGLLGARQIRLSGDGQHIYVASGSGRSLAHYRVSDVAAAPAFAGIVRAGDAAPLSGGQVLGLNGAADVFIPAGGRQAYAVASVDSAISTFERSIDADPALSTGALDYRASLFDGLGGIAPGESVSYVIQVDNLGPSAVSQARVVDSFPPEFSQVSWSCSASGGAACPLIGSGNIDVIVQLPVGGQVVFVATGVVGQSATGRLVNTATVAAAGAVDPNEANNSSTDDNTVLSPASELVVSVDDGSPIAIPGGRVDYLADISNLGPSYAVGVRVTDTAPAALYDRAWTCEAFPKAGALDLRQSFAGSLDSYTAVAPAGFGRLAYATGSLGGIGAVALLTRDPLTGALSLPELPTGVEAILLNEQAGVRGIGGAADLLLSNDERFVYVAGRSSDSVAVFSRNAGNGSLNFVAQYQDGELGIDGIGGVHRLLMSPDGRHLYAAGSVENAIAVFNVNASSGLLSPASLLRQSIAGVDGLNGIRDIRFNATASHLLVTAGANQSLAAFARNSSTGALSPFALVQDFELSERLLTDPRALRFGGDTVWVAGGSNNTVAGFRFDPAATPALQLARVIREGENGVSGLITPDALQFEDDQSRLYVGAAGRLFLFSLQPQQPLLLDSYSQQPPLGGALRLISSSDRQQLYSASAGSGGLGVWARARGSRCPLGGSGPIGEVTVDISAAGRVEFSVGGRVYPNALGILDYTVRAATRIAAEELNPANNVDTDSDLLQPAPDLSAAKTDGLTEVVAGLPLSYTIDLANAGVSDALEALLLDPLPIFPTVNAGLVTNEGRWSCSANLPLQDLARLTPADSSTVAGIGASRRSPDGRRLYAVNPALNALLVFPLDAQGVPGTPEVISDGSSLGTTTVQGLAGASMVTLSADGLHVYVTGATANSLLLLRFDPSSGEHSFGQRLQSGVGGVAGLQGAADVHVSADGRFVFVASASSHAIAVFSRSATTGELAFVERVADGLGTIVPDSNVIRGVRRLALSADGARLYAAATLSQAVTRFDIGADGRLQFRGRLRHDQPGMASLAGARALALSPGDRQLYVLGSQAITRLRPQADGSLLSEASLSGIAELATARDIKLDATGSRLYLADSAGALFVFARDWADGALDLRYRLPPAAIATGVPEVNLGALAADDVMYLSEAGGSLRQLGQRALSRCLGEQTNPDLIDTTLDLGVGGTAQFEYAVRVHPSARGVLTNVATVSPGEGIDPAPANNDGIDTTQIRAVSDLSVSKTGPIQAVAGLRLGYVIEVGNTGPSDSLGMQVIDTLPTALNGATWTCVASAGSSCPASGSGSLAMTATVLVGGNLRIEIDAPIASSYLGALVNTVSLVLEPDATDPDLENNTDSVDTEVIAIADAGVTKTNGVDELVAGERTVYTVTATNIGPSDAPQVRVRDLLAAEFRDALWTCSGQGGGVCPASGSGSIDRVVALPAGATVVFLLDVQVASDTRGSISNTASVAVQGAPTDPQPGNNSATDTDAVRVVHDLAVSLLDPLDPFDSSGSISLPYVVQIDNLGASDAVGVNLRLSFSAAVQQQIGLPCVPAGNNAIDCELGTLRAGSSRVLDMGILQLPPPPGIFTLTATVGGGDGLDPQLANNTAIEQTELRAGIDLQVGIDNGISSIEPGASSIYTVLVTNIGSVTAATVEVEVPLAVGLIDASWTCTGQGGASCAPAGSGGISETVSLARGQAVRYRLTARLDPLADPGGSPRVSQTASALPLAPATDINTGNNTAVDEDLIQFILFRDGFEGASLLGPSAAKVFSLAGSCSALRIDAASPLLAGVLGEARQRTLLHASDSRGQTLAQVEVLQANSGRWLRLRSPQQTGEWQRWSSRFAALSAPQSGLRLDAGAAARSQLAPAIVARDWSPAAGIEVVPFTACSGSVADGDSHE